MEHTGEENEGKKERKMERNARGKTVEKHTGSPDIMRLNYWIRFCRLAM